MARRTSLRAFLVRAPQRSQYAAPVTSWAPQLSQATWAGCSTEMESTGRVFLS